jgi:hypothetical protein
MMEAPDRINYISEAAYDQALRAFYRASHTEYYTTAKQLLERSYVTGRWICDDELRYKELPMETGEQRKRREELESYNDIFGRSVGISMYTGTYLSWRKEFEETGAEFAKERMEAVYRPGDELKWEQGLKNRPISIWKDTPLIPLILAVFLIVMLVAFLVVL